jgi:hypothetical protein
MAQEHKSSDIEGLDVEMDTNTDLILVSSEGDKESVPKKVALMSELIKTMVGGGKTIYTHSTHTIIIILE